MNKNTIHEQHRIQRMSPIKHNIAHKSKNIITAVWTKKLSMNSTEYKEWVQIKHDRLREASHYNCDETITIHEQHTIQRLSPDQARQTERGLTITSHAQCSLACGQVLTGATRASICATAAIGAHFCYLSDHWSTESTIQRLGGFHPVKDMPNTLTTSHITDTHLRMNL